MTFRHFWNKIRPSRKVIPIQVGLDFGTSCSKIVYSEIGGRHSNAVVFDQQLPHFPPFALPSLLAIDVTFFLVNLNDLPFCHNCLFLDGFAGPLGPGVAGSLASLTII